MSKFTKVQMAQQPSVITAKLKFNDTVATAAGDAELSTVAIKAFDLCDMPAGAVIVGGSLVVTTAVTGSTTATLKLGTAAGGETILASKTLATAGASALLVNGAPFNGSTPVVATVEATGSAMTAGEFLVAIQYIVPGREDEVTG